MKSDTGRLMLQHDAFFYRGAAELARELGPFVADGLAAGDPVIAVTTTENIQTLSAALGGDADRVEWIDATDWYGHPVRTIASYATALEERVAAGSDLVRVIGEVSVGVGDRERRQWARYEAVLNRAFAWWPAWIVCPYDLESLPPDVIEDAARTHPGSFGDGRGPGDSYVDPKEFLRRTDVRVETPAGNPDIGVEVRDPIELSAARAMLSLSLARCPVDEVTAEVLVAAANEIVTNGLVHGAGDVEVRIWLLPERWVCEVSDQGPGIDDPFAGYIPPGLAPESGRGLWIARRTFDEVDVRRRDGRFAVTLVHRLPEARTT